MADINAIVEEIKALSLLEVKELTDALKETFGVEAIAMGAPATLKEAVYKDEAEQLKAKLEEVGAKVELK